MKKTHTILLVDDDPDIRASLRRALHDTEYRVIEAGSGEHGVEFLQSESVIDVVISDFSMPGMNGVDFLHQVRMRRPDALRVILTGELDVQVAARALNEGAAHKFLLKPWERVDLINTVRIAQRTVPRAHVSPPAPKDAR